MGGVRNKLGYRDIPASKKNVSYVQCSHKSSFLFLLKSYEILLGRVLQSYSSGPDFFYPHNVFIWSRHICTDKKRLLLQFSNVWPRQIIFRYLSGTDELYSDKYACSSVICEGQTMYGQKCQINALYLGKYVMAR